MSDTMEAGDTRRLEPCDQHLPEPPEHDTEGEDDADQPEPEEVPDAVLDH
jgi:hypothetical protein